MTASMLPFLLYAVVVVGVLVVVMVASWFIGSRATHGGAKDIPYESGVVPVGDAENMRLSIEFYLIAIFFVIFDLETIFIVAWAVAFKEVGLVGYIAASIFIVMLLVALLYEYRTGALEWGTKRRQFKPTSYAVEDAA
ncbi:MAG: NADH-quinone oxidoreductase subunit A [Gammaproteobacteria bacterium]|nr:NADH-quinone oxidoreductase subunit A [Gammaproteobacteria bacterium]